MRVNGILLAALLLPGLGSTAAGAEGEEAEGGGLRPAISFGFETKAHVRDSEQFRIPTSFPFQPEQIPPGQDNVFLQTVNEGTHAEISTFTLYLDATWGEAVAAHAKVDFIDLYDRNPTSTDDEVDVDEAWLRFGREVEPGELPERWGAYLKVGKMPKFERQDDRHLESYGLVATAFNRMEDLGAELGIDLGRYLYIKATVTQGNPLFMRDPNALAGDNGLPSFLTTANPNPSLKSGVLIPYDAEVEDIDVDGDLEVGYGLGVRFGDATGFWSVDALAWAYQRELAETVELEGTFYGGDLDLLRGPRNRFSFPITDNDKEEVGANLWVYVGGFSFFAQYVDQELAGLSRTGFEVEVAWTFDLPYAWAVGGHQLFPYIAPAARFSNLHPDFGIGLSNPLQTPTPSFAWEWDKTDYGLRLGIIAGTDLTIEYADNEFTLFNGAKRSNDELLTTLRWRLGKR